MFVTHNIFVTVDPRCMKLVLYFAPYKTLQVIKTYHAISKVFLRI